MNPYDERVIRAKKKVCGLSCRKDGYASNATHHPTRKRKYGSDHQALWDGQAWGHAGLPAMVLQGASDGNLDPFDDGALCYCRALFYGTGIIFSFTLVGLGSS